MSTIEATLSSKAVVSSLNESDDNVSEKTSELDEINTEYLKVKTKKISACQQQVGNIQKLIYEKFSIKVDIILLQDGHYREYFKISTEKKFPTAIEEVKRLLLEIENEHESK